MIHVIATLETAPGQRAALLAEFQKIVPLVHAEDGCLGYETAIDVSSGLGSQGPVREDAVTVVEKWASVEALRAHSSAAHMEVFRERVKDIVKSVRLQVVQPA